MPTPGTTSEQAFPIPTLNVIPTISVIQPPLTYIHDMSALGASKSEVGIMENPTPLLKPLSKAMLDVCKQIDWPLSMFAPRGYSSQPQLDGLEAEHAFPMLNTNILSNVLSKTKHSLSEGNGFLLCKYR
jgi:hypothetical protein